MILSWLDTEPKPDLPTLVLTRDSNSGVWLVTFEADWLIIVMYASANMVNQYPDLADQESTLNSQLSYFTAG